MKICPNHFYLSIFYGEWSSFSSILQLRRCNLYPGWNMAVWVWYCGSLCSSSWQKWSLQLDFSLFLPFFGRCISWEFSQNKMHSLFFHCAFVLLLFPHFPPFFPLIVSNVLMERCAVDGPTSSRPLFFSIASPAPFHSPGGTEDAFGQVPFQLLLAEFPFAAEKGPAAGRAHSTPPTPLQQQERVQGLATKGLGEREEEGREEQEQCFIAVQPRRSQLPALVDGHSLPGLVVRGNWDGLDLLNHVHSCNDTTEYDVLPVQPGGRCQCDEELRAATQTSQSCGGNSQNARQKTKGRSKKKYPLVEGPALAMDRIPGPTWRSLKFSSANLAP